MKKIQDGSKAFIIKLQALYDIEQTVAKALPKMEKAAAHPDLREGFRLHLEETKKQIKRLEDAFKKLGEKPKKLKSEGIRGIIADGQWVMEIETTNPNLKDGMLAGAARYVEHYEMAGYLSAIEEAKILSFMDIAALLEESLEEEEATDKKLAKMVRSAMAE